MSGDTGREGMARVNVVRWRMGDEAVLLVPLGCRARDRLPVRCPVCGAEVGEVLLESSREAAEPER